MFFPYRDDNPRRHGPPLATLAIIGISTAVYVLVQLPLGPYEGQAYALSFGFIPAVFFGEAELVNELARVPSTATLFTSMFLAWRADAPRGQTCGSSGFTATTSRMPWVGSATCSST